MSSTGEAGARQRGWVTANSGRRTVSICSAIRSNTSIATSIQGAGTQHGKIYQRVRAQQFAAWTAALDSEAGGRNTRAM
ncbi:MAG: hypothetical protein U1F54_09895 [Burkholderiales bacterium]